MPVKLRTIVREHRRILVALFEISRMAGVSRQRAAHMARESWFPAEVECLKSGTCWWRYQVEDALSAKGFLESEPIGLRPKELFSLLLPMVSPEDLAALLLTEAA